MTDYIKSLIRKAKAEGLRLSLVDAVFAYAHESIREGFSVYAGDGLHIHRIEDIRLCNDKLQIKPSHEWVTVSPHSISYLKGTTV